MTTLQEVKAKYQRQIDSKENMPRRQRAILGDGKGVIKVEGQAGYVHHRLEDGTYNGVVFNNKIPQADLADSNDLPVVVGYSHEQPDLFQVLEVRLVQGATTSGAPPTQIGNVTGLIHAWMRGRTLYLSWQAYPIVNSPLFSNFRISVDGVHYNTVSNIFNYTRDMNEDDHSDVFDPVLSISVVAVDIYGGISLTPATLTATWTRPTLPDVATGAAVWSNDDVLFTWADIVRPYTFSHFLVTVVTSASITYVSTANYFLYTASMNRMDNSGIPDTVIQVSIVAVDEDGYTSATPLVIDTTNTGPVGDTISENFDSYGGDQAAQNANAALNWLSIAEADGDPDEYLSNATLDSTHITQGNTAALGAAGTSTNSLTKNPDDGLDLSNDNRFTNSDYIVVSVYCANADQDFSLAIVDIGAHLRFSTINDLPAGWNYLKIKRSDLSGTGDFDWSQVAVGFSRQQSGGSPGTGSVWIDDIRISKADPDDATTFNDTGSAWDFSAGTWHIYQDVPGLYALGQIDTLATTRKVGIKTGSYAVSNHIATGLLLREDGAAGMLAMAVDASNGYEIKLDTAGDTAKLLKWVSGTSSELASVSISLAPNTRYYVGLKRSGDYLFAFLGTTPGNVFSAPNLFAFVNDTTYLQGKVGVTSYGVNSRFFQLRAGSPEHALTAEYAFTTDPLGHIHATDNGWADATGTPTRSTFVTSTVTTEQLAERVKALIDDLKADGLIK
jgi:hypothetical protein